MTDISEKEIDLLGRASRRAALISTLGFLVVLGAIGYAVLSLGKLEQQRQELEQQKASLQTQIGALRQQTGELTQTQEGVLDFLVGVTASENIRLISPDVDWKRTKEQLVRMPAGPRKSALLQAILLAWKEIPFSIQNKGMTKGGVDSPHFVNLVLTASHIRVEQAPGERLSDAMMRQFQRVPKPLPGDLVFYRGNVGSFVLMYMGDSPRGEGVAIGTLQTGEELQVLDLLDINTASYPMIGYFRVPFEKRG